MELRIKVICEDLPDTDSLDTKGCESFARRQILIGIQRGDDVVEAVPTDQKRVVFEPSFRVSPLPDGKTNFLGPYAKGKPAERFFYLSWVVKSEEGRLTRFGRAKVHLSHLPWSEVEESVRKGKPLSVTLSLTGKRGDPRCGSIRGDGIRWQA